MKKNAMENIAYQMGFLQGSLGCACEYNLTVDSDRLRSFWFAGWQMGHEG